MNSRPRVALINTELRRGGAARTAATLTAALNNAGVASVSMFHCENAEEDPPYIGKRKPLSRPINALLARIGGSLAVVDRGVAKELAADTLNAFDILHVHNLHGYYLNYRRLLNAWKTKPVVWTWHDMWAVTGRCAQAQDCQRWLKGCGQCPQLNYYPAAWLDFSSYEHRTKKQLTRSLTRLTIVTPSTWLADIAHTSGFSKEQIRVIPNPVDLSKYRPLDKRVARQELGLDEERTVLLFVASDCGDPEKGYADFAALAAKSSTTAVAVGKPPAKPAPGILHTGRITDSVVLSKYYSAADCMVMVSYAENYPNIVMEALACGTPVIGYAVGGIPSQVPEGGGTLVDRGDVSSLGQCIDELQRQGGKSHTIANKLHEHATKQWNLEKIAQLYGDVYRQALAG